MVVSFSEPQQLLGDRRADLPDNLKTGRPSDFSQPFFHLGPNRVVAKGGNEVMACWRKTCHEHTDWNRWIASGRRISWKTLPLTRKPADLAFQYKLAETATLCLLQHVWEKP